MERVDTALARYRRAARIWLSDGDTLMQMMREDGQDFSRPLDYVWWLRGKAMPEASRWCPATS